MFFTIRYTCVLKNMRLTHCMRNMHCVTRFTSLPCVKRTFNMRFKKRMFYACCTFSCVMFFPLYILSSCSPKNLVIITNRVFLKKKKYNFRYLIVQKTWVIMHDLYVIYMEKINIALYIQSNIIKYVFKAYVNFVNASYPHCHLIMTYVYLLAGLQSNSGF